MAGEPEIKTKISIMGDKEYKSALAGINSALNVAKSNLSAVSSAYDKNDKSMAAMSARQKALTQLQEQQAKKVQLLKDRLASMEASGTASAQSIDKMKVSLNNAQTALNKTTNELNQIKGAAGTAGDKLKAFAEKAGSIGAAVARVSVKALAVSLTAVTAAAGAATAAAFKFAQGAGQYADDILTLSTQTGVAAEELQGWSYAARFIDTDSETMTKSMAKLTKQMGSAANGNKTATKAFKKLGVAIKDENGELRDNQDVFMDAIDALGKIENETERDAMAMDLFGKSAQELNPLIEAGGEKLSQLTDEAKEMGLVMSDDALSAMGSFDDSMQRVDAVMTGLKNTIGAVLIPAFQPLVDKAVSAMGEVNKALADGLQPGELKEITDKLVDAASDMIDDVGVMIAEFAPEAVNILTGIVDSIVAALPTMMPSLMDAALNMLTGVMDTVAQNTEPLVNLAVQMIENLGNFLVENLPVLIDAAGQVMIALADGIIDHIDELIPITLEIITHIASGLIEHLPVLIAEIPKIVEAIWNGLKEADWAGMGNELLTALKNSMIAVADIMADVGIRIWEAIQSAFIGVGEWGQNLIDGMMNGLSAAVGGAIDRVKGFFESIWQAVLGVFGIASPSTEAASAAGFIMEGFLNGLSEAVGAAVAKVKEIFGQIWDAIKSIFGFGGESAESKDARMAGEDVMSGFQQGIETGQRSVQESIMAAAHSATTAFRAEFGIGEGSGSSSIMKSFGESMMKSMGEGISGADFTSIASTAQNSAHSAFSTAFATSKYEDIGKNVAAGIAAGIKNNQSKITQAAKEAAKSAYDAAKAALDINSPSKVMMKIGSGFDEGFVKGIRGGINSAVRAARDMADSAVTGSREALDNIPNANPKGSIVSGAGTTVNVSYSGAFTRSEARRFGRAFADEMSAAALVRGG